jgi:hypothetical protein
MMKDERPPPTLPRHHVLFFSTKDKEKNNIMVSLYDRRLENLETCIHSRTRHGTHALHDLSTSHQMEAERLLAVAQVSELSH